MKNLMKLICVLSIGIFGIAFAQETIQLAPTTLEPGTWAVIIGAASSLLTVPLTNVLQQVLGTTGIKTQLINASLNAIFAGLLPLFSGTYTGRPEAVLWAIVASVTGILTDRRTYGTLKQAASSVLRSERADLISKLVFVPENLPQTPSESEQ